MFSGLTPAAQIILSVSILIALILIMIIVWKKGIKFATKHGSIRIGNKEYGDGNQALEVVTLTIHEIESLIEVIIDSMEEVVKLNNNMATEKKLDYVEVKLSEFQGLKEDRFYKLLKEKGVPHNDLNSHPDAIHYTNVLISAIYRDNGESGIKSMIRKPLRHKTYDKSNEPEVIRSDLEEKFIEEFTGQVNQKLRKHFRSHYTTNIIDYDGNNRKRIITNEELYDIDNEKSHLKDLENLLDDIFNNARRIDLDVEHEKYELLKKRKEKIGRMISLNKVVK